MFGPLTVMIMALALLGSGALGWCAAVQEEKVQRGRSSDNGQ